MFCGFPVRDTNFKLRSSCCVRLPSLPNLELIYKLSFAFKDSSSSCLITIPKNDDYKYVVMPMRI